MIFRTLAFSLTGLLLVGCAAQSPMPQLSPDHPANPAAAEAPVAIRSDTLSMNQDAVPVSAKPAMEDMAGMKGNDMPGKPPAHVMPSHNMPGMSLEDMKGHDMPGMSHDPAVPEGHSVPATMPASGNPAAATQAAYVCPMHPKVTSDKPGKCPICNMTLKKKVGK